MLEAINHALDLDMVMDLPEEHQIKAIFELKNGFDALEKLQMSPHQEIKDLTVNVISRHLDYDEAMEGAPNDNASLATN